MSPSPSPAPPPFRRYRTRARLRRRAAAMLATTVAVALVGLALAALAAGDLALPGAGAPTAGAGPVGVRDGYLGVGASVSPFSAKPVVTRLDPALRDAVRAAAADARVAGVELRVTSGWRSPRYQELLLRRAAATYGSTEAARRYVKPPSESSHVTGEAVDVGPTDADDWLSRHGGAYGLCQVYANEMWHFERATEPGGTCPEMAADAAGEQP